MEVRHVSPWTYSVGKLCWCRIAHWSLSFQSNRDKIYYPFYTNIMVTDKSEYKAIANHIVNVWDVETLIPAHGDIMRGKDFIRTVLTEYFQL